MYHVYMLHEACIRTQMPAEFQLLASAPPHNFISLRMLGGCDRFVPVQHTEYVFVLHALHACSLPMSGSDTHLYSVAGAVQIQVRMSCYNCAIAATAGMSRALHVAMSLFFSSYVVSACLVWRSLFGDLCL